MELNDDLYRNSGFHLSNGIELTETQRIAEENDLFRKFLSGRSIKLSDGMTVLEMDTINAVIEKVRNYDFDEANLAASQDRRQGAIEHEDVLYEWIIYGYYNEFGIPDDYQMNRNLLIKLASEPEPINKAN